MKPNHLILGVGEASRVAFAVVVADFAPTPNFVSSVFNDNVCVHHVFFFSSCTPRSSFESMVILWAFFCLLFFRIEWPRWVPSPRPFLDFLSLLACFRLASSRTKRRLAAGGKLSKEAWVHPLSYSRLACLG